MMILSIHFPGGLLCLSWWKGVIGFFDIARLLVLASQAVSNRYEDDDDEDNGIEDDD